jgi:ribosomal protein S13
MKFFTNEENKNNKFSYCLMKMFGVGVIVGQFESIKIVGLPLRKALNLKVKRVGMDSLIKIDKLFGDREIQSHLIKKLDNFRDILINIKSYRGLRYMSGLPVNGQRTQTNARTCKHRRFRKSLNMVGIKKIKVGGGLSKKKYTKKSGFNNKYKKYFKKVKNKKYGKRK